MVPNKVEPQDSAASNPVATLSALHNMHAAALSTLHTEATGKPDILAEIHQLKQELNASNARIKKLEEKNKKNPDWIDNFEEENKEISSTLGYAAEFLSFLRELKIFKMITDVVIQVAKSCRDIYKAFPKMSLQQKVAAMGIMIMMTAGVTIMLVGLVQTLVLPSPVSALPPVGGAALAVLGAYLARKFIKSLNAPTVSVEGLEAQLSYTQRLAQGLHDLFTAPGRALSYAFDKCKRAPTSGVAPDDKLSPDSKPDLEIGLLPSAPGIRA
jgi:hypothetical protein